MAAHSLLDTVREFVAEHDLLEGVSRVVVGVSGGVDSMALLDVLRRLGREVYAVHLNYQLREAASGDAEFVRQWCESQSPPIPLDVTRADAQARADRQDESLQEAARRLRYARFAEVAQQVGAQAVAVGHHRDDQAETVLLHLVRGSGPEGLAGMPPSRPLREAPTIPLIRPLLPVRRAAITTYAEAEDIPWREDATNESHAYRRGVVRSEILPLLNQHFPGATESMARSADLMRRYVEATVEPILKSTVDAAFASTPSGGGRLHDTVLRDLPRIWQQRLVLEALKRALPEAPQTQAVAQEVTGLFSAQVGARVELGGGAVWRTRDGLRFVPSAAAPETLPPTPLPWGTVVDLPAGRLAAEHLDAAPESLSAGAPQTVIADADALPAKLVVRSWRAGDRLQPLGMQGTKLVSDLLTDRRVPPHERDAVYVLTDADATERIVWVVGHRLDHRVRVRPSTQQFAKFTFCPRENRAAAYQSP